jgi:hypothetical protein
MKKPPQILNELITQPKKTNTTKQPKTSIPKKIVYVLNKNSEAYKFVKNARETGEMVDFSSLTDDEFKKLF